MKKYVYSVYYVDELKNDIKFIKEYKNAEEIAKDYKLKNKKSIYHFLYNSLDNINLLEIKKKLNNCIIFKDMVED